MITQRFRPVVWVVGVAVATTALYLVSLRVATERGRLEAIDRQIASTHREIRQLQTELGTRASLRQLEKWNGEALALSAPDANQFLPGERSLATLKGDHVGGNTAPPPVMVAAADVVSAPVPGQATATDVVAGPAVVPRQVVEAPLADLIASPAKAAETNHHAVAPSQKGKTAQ